MGSLLTAAPDDSLSFSVVDGVFRYVFTSGLPYNRPVIAIPNDDSVNVSRHDVASIRLSDTH